MPAKPEETSAARPDRRTNGLLGEKTDRPSRHQTLIGTLEWAVQLARTLDSGQLPGAASAYDEVDTLRPALPRAPICTDPEARHLEMVGRDLREFVADAVRRARVCDLRAVECLEAALASIPMG